MRKIFSSTAVGLALGALALSPAIAQSTSTEMPMRGMMGGDCPMMKMMDGRGMRMGMMRGRRMGKGMMRGQARMAAMAEGRLAFLKSELKITDAQNPAWEDYAGSVKARIATMQSTRQTMMESMQSGNALQRMDARISGMEAMLSSMKAIKPATEKLYATLTAEQKTVADQLIGADCGAM